MTREEVAILWKDANGWDVRGYTNTLEDLGRFARLVVAKEREACAKVCESEGIRIDASYLTCAEAIRARGDYT